jgi:hypothetical protein
MNERQRKGQQKEIKKESKTKRGRKKAKGQQKEIKEEKETILITIFLIFISSLSLLLFIRYLFSIWLKFTVHISFQAKVEVRGRR